MASIQMGDDFSLKRHVVHCSLPEALEAMGERWSFLLLRAAFNGLTRFEEFQAALGIARNILSNRLVRLTEHGILERCPCTDDRRRVDYRLTAKGEELLPVLVALRQWGERWGSGGPANPVLVDARDRRPVERVTLRAQDGRTLGVHDLTWVDRATLDGTTLGGTTLGGTRLDRARLDGAAPDGG